MVSRLDMGGCTCVWTHACVYPDDYKLKWEAMGRESMDLGSSHRNLVFKV